MASAPRPGVGKRNAAKQQAQRTIRITVAGESYSFAPDNIPFGEQIAVRKACGGLPFSAFWGGENTVGVDSLQVMYWLARRASGEPNLTLGTVLDEWPDTLNPDDFEVAVIEPGDETETEESPN